MLGLWCVVVERVEQVVEVGGGEPKQKRSANSKRLATGSPSNHSPKPDNTRHRSVTSGGHRIFVRVHPRPPWSDSAGQAHVHVRRRTHATRRGRPESTSQAEDVGSIPVIVIAGSRVSADWLADSDTVRCADGVIPLERLVQCDCTAPETASQGAVRGVGAPTGQRNTHPTHGCALPRSFRRTHRLVVVHANAQRRSTLRCPGVFAHQTFQCGPSDRTGFSGRLSLLRVNMGIRQGWSSCGHIRSISALSSAPSSTTNAMT